MVSMHPLVYIEPATGFLVFFFSLVLCFVLSPCAVSSGTVLSKSCRLPLHINPAQASRGPSGPTVMFVLSMGLLLEQL